jgi:hypothetical protein
MGQNLINSLSGTVRLTIPSSTGPNTAPICTEHKQTHHELSNVSYPSLESTIEAFNRPRWHSQRQILTPTLTLDEGVHFHVARTLHVYMYVYTYVEQMIAK